MSSWLQSLSLCGHISDGVADAESLAAIAEHIQFFLLIDQILRRSLSISLFLLLCAIPRLMDSRTASPAVLSAFARTSYVENT